jgi:hypothetical protein
MSLSLGLASIHTVEVELTYLLPMKQPATHGLEVHTTELANDVRRASFGSPVGSAFDPWGHAFDFVLDEALPVFTVDVALFAVEVGRVVDLVSLHLFLCVEALIATFDVTLDSLDGVKWYHHLVGLERVGIVAGGSDDLWSLFAACVVLGLVSLFYWWCWG